MQATRAGTEKPARNVASLTKPSKGRIEKLSLAAVIAEPFTEVQKVLCRVEEEIVDARR